MRVLIKIGGSLQHFPRALEALCQQITFASGDHTLYILPGGGTFADKIRELDQQYNLTPANAHWMAITAMEAYAYLLHSNIHGSVISSELPEYSLNKPTIILPYLHLKEVDVFPHSWTVTSDSIALYYASLLKSDLILIKVVDGISDAHGSLITELAVTELKTIKTDVLDLKFAETFQQFNIRYCWLINGLFPDRLANFFREKRTIGTKIQKDAKNSNV